MRVVKSQCALLAPYRRQQHCDFDEAWMPNGWAAGTQSLPYTGSTVSSASSTGFSTTAAGVIATYHSQHARPDAILSLIHI